MGETTKASGLIRSCMALALIIGKMGKSIPENIIMIRNMGMGYINSKIVGLMKDGGLMVNNTVWVSSYLKTKMVK